MSRAGFVAVGLVGCGLACCGPGTQTTAIPAEAPRELVVDAPSAAPVPGRAELDALEQAVAQAPEDAAARRRLARALFKAEHKTRSVEHFEKVAELRPDERSLLDLGLVYGALSRLDDAVAAYERLLQIEPGHAQALHNQGNIALKRGEVERAIQLYRRSIDSSPAYINAHYHLGDALRQAGRSEEAYRAYEKVLELEPSNAEELVVYYDSLYRLAALDIDNGAHQRAGRMLAELLQVHPGHPNAHYAYGQVLLQLGYPEQARIEFDKHMQVQAQARPTGPMASAE